MNPNPQLFSNIDYYKNYNFQRLMRNWNLYLNSEETDEDILSTWEEVLLKDFLSGAREWLANNRNEVFWRCDLK